MKKGEGKKRLRDYYQILRDDSQKRVWGTKRKELMHTGPWVSRETAGPLHSFPVTQRRVMPTGPGETAQKRLWTGGDRGRDK